jgi:O-antigen/teichoic acid export membrane protein
MDYQLNNNDNADNVLFIKKLARDTLIYIPAKIFPAIMSVVGVVLFTRLFSPEEYGKYVLVITTTTILTAILSQWMIQATLRYRAQYIGINQGTVFNRNLLTILFLLTVTILILSLGFYNFRSIFGEYKDYYIISVLIIISGIWFNNLIALFQSDLKSQKFTLYTVVQAFLRVTLPIALILLIKKDIFFLLYGLLFCSFIPIIPMLLSIGNDNKNFCTSADSTILSKKNLFLFLKQFFYYGFPMVGWFLGAQLLSMSDRYFLQFFRGSNEVGIYSSNYNLVASAISFVTMPLLTAAHPLLMKAGITISHRKEKVESLITNFSRYYSLMTIPIIIYIVFSYKKITELILGVDFRPGGVVLPIVLFGLIAWNFAMFGHKGLEFRNKTRTMFLYVIICTIIKIILNFLFIPRYGFIAAAFTTLVAFLIYPVLVYYGTKNDIKWNIPWMSIVKSLIAAIIPVGILFAIDGWQINSLIKITIDAFIMVCGYIPLLFLLKEIRPQESKYLKKAFNTFVLRRNNNTKTDA